MDVKTAIQTRRAVKHFDPQHEMTAAEEKELLSLAAHSPTAFNIQNWRFVVVRSREQRQKIRAAAWDQAQVTEASLLVVLCADLKSWTKQPQRYWQNVPDGVRDFMLPALDGYYRNRHGVQRDEAMRSCGIAAQTLMLAAKGMGYDTCPMDGFDFDAVAKIINLPEDHVIAMMVVIGKGLREPWARAGQLPLESVTVSNGF